MQLNFKRDYLEKSIENIDIIYDYFDDQGLIDAKKRFWI
jgi:hypothetical protein